MHIECFNREDWTVVKIVGRIDSFTYPHLAQEINVLMRSGVKKLQLDFADNTYFSFQGYRFLQNILEILAKREGILKCVHTNDETKEVMQLMNQKNAQWMVLE